MDSSDLASDALHVYRLGFLFELPDNDSPLSSHGSGLIRWFRYQILRLEAPFLNLTRPKI